VHHFVSLHLGMPCKCSFLIPHFTFGRQRFMSVVVRIGRYCLFRAWSVQFVVVVAFFLASLRFVVCLCVFVVSFDCVLLCVSFRVVCAFWCLSSLRFCVSFRHCGLLCASRCVFVVFSVVLLCSWCVFIVAVFVVVLPSRLRMYGMSFLREIPVSIHVRS